MLYLIAFSIISWILLCIFAIINGTIRVKLYTNIFGDLIAHQISTIILSAIIIIYTYILEIIFPFNFISGIYLGIFWLILTILFEFGFGHYIRKKSWSELLVDYNIKKGRIWILILITTLVAPILVNLF